MLSNRPLTLIILNFLIKIFLSLNQFDHPKRFKSFQPSSGYGDSKK